MAREYVSKDNKELFEEMVQDWIYDAETNPEYEDLEYDDEPEWDEDLNRWYLHCEDQKYAYSLYDEGDGEIRIHSEGIKPFPRNWTYCERRIVYYDMDEKGFDDNDQQYAEKANYEIYEDSLYTIEDDYSDHADVHLEPIKEYGAGWYWYEIEDDEGNTSKRYVYVDRIERRNKDGDWVIDGSRQAEFGRPLSVTELAEAAGKSERNVYRLAEKLGRLPTVAELKAVKRGAPKKYQ